MSDCHVFVVFVGLISSLFLIVSGVSDINNLQKCPNEYLTCDTKNSINVFCIKNFDVLGYDQTCGHDHKVCNHMCYENATYASPISDTDVIRTGWNEIIIGTVFLVIITLLLIYDCVRCILKKRNTSRTGVNDVQETVTV